MEKLTRRQKEVFDKITQWLTENKYFQPNRDKDVFFVFGEKWVSYRILTILITKKYLKLKGSNPFKGYRYVLYDEKNNG